jgi:hypothetical protein
VVNFSVRNPGNFSVRNKSAACNASDVHAFQRSPAGTCAIDRRCDVTSCCPAVEASFFL